MDTVLEQPAQGQAPNGLPFSFRSQPVTQAKPSTVVIAWDLDETLIIFNSLINGSYASAVNEAVAREASTQGPSPWALQKVNAEEAKALGNKVADGIFDFLDAHLWYPQVEHMDPMHLSDTHMGMDKASSSAPALHVSGRAEPSALAHRPINQSWAGAASSSPHTAATGGPHGHLAAAASTAPGLNGLRQVATGSTPASEHGAGPFATHAMFPLSPVHPVDTHTAAGASASFAVPILSRPSLKRGTQAPSSSQEFWHGPQSGTLTVSNASAATSRAGSIANTTFGEAGLAASTRSPSNSSILFGEQAPSSRGPSTTSITFGDPGPSVPGSVSRGPSAPGSVSSPSRAPSGTCNVGRTSSSYRGANGSLNARGSGRGGAACAGAGPQAMAGQPGPGGTAPDFHEPPALPVPMTGTGPGFDHDTSLKRARSSDTQCGLSHAQVFTRIAHVYAGGMKSVAMTQQERTKLQQNREAVDALTGGWLTAAAALLEGITRVGAAQACTVHHCIVTTGQLVATLGKLMLFGLDEHFPADNVYSASKQTKLAAFKRLRSRWGVRAAYLAVGDSVEERRGAASMKWPCIQITLAPRPAWPPGQPAHASTPLRTLALNAAHARDIRSHVLTLALDTLAPSPTSHMLSISPQSTLSSPMSDHPGPMLWAHQGPHAHHQGATEAHQPHHQIRFWPLSAPTHPVPHTGGPEAPHQIQFWPQGDVLPLLSHGMPAAVLQPPAHKPDSSKPSDTTGQTPPKVHIWPHNNTPPPAPVSAPVPATGSSTPRLFQASAPVSPHRPPGMPSQPNSPQQALVASNRHSNCALADSILHPSDHSLQNLLVDAVAQAAMLPGSGEVMQTCASFQSLPDATVVVSASCSSTPPPSCASLDSLPEDAGALLPLLQGTQAVQGIQSVQRSQPQPGKLGQNASGSPGKQQQPSRPTGVWHGSAAHATAAPAASVTAAVVNALTQPSANGPHSNGDVTPMRPSFDSWRPSGQAASDNVAGQAVEDPFAVASKGSQLESDRMLDQPGPLIFQPPPPSAYFPLPKPDSWEIMSHQVSCSSLSQQMSMQMSGLLPQSDPGSLSPAGPSTEPSTSGAGGHDRSAAATPPGFSIPAARGKGVPPVRSSSGLEPATTSPAVAWATVSHRNGSIRTMFHSLSGPPEEISIGGAISSMPSPSPATNGVATVRTARQDGTMPMLTEAAVASSGGAAALTARGEAVVPGVEAAAKVHAGGEAMHPRGGDVAMQGKSTQGAEINDVDTPMRGTSEDGAPALGPGDVAWPTGGDMAAAGQGIAMQPTQGTISQPGANRRDAAMHPSKPEGDTTQPTLGMDGQVTEQGAAADLMTHVGSANLLVESPIRESPGHGATGTATPCGEGHAMDCTHTNNPATMPEVQTAMHAGKSASGSPAAAVRTMMPASDMARGMAGDGVIAYVYESGASGTGSEPNPSPASGKGRAQVEAGEVGPAGQGKATLPVAEVEEVPPAPIVEIPEAGVSLQQLWPQLVLDLALRGLPRQPTDE